jgi:acyl-CoA thioesterase
MDASERVVISDVGADTRVVPEGSTPGRYLATIPTWWNAQFAFGGMTSTIALRAAEAAIGRPELVPVSATAVFCSPVPCGDVVVDTDVLRTGTSVAHGQSVLRAAGSDQIGVRMLAIFGQQRESDLRFVDAAFPHDVAPPGECDLLVPPPGWPLSQSPVFSHHEVRRAVGKAPWEEGWSPGRPRIASWTRYHKPARLADGSIDPVTYFLPADHMMPAVSQALGPREQRMLVSLEISMQFFETTMGSWLLQHSYARHAGAGYVFGHVELWDEERRLLAIAAQRARVAGISS